jgi:Fur family transcriptional regulator, ferric uptake regulator
VNENQSHFRFPRILLVSGMVVNIGFVSYGPLMTPTGDETGAQLLAAGLSPTPRRRQVLEAVCGRRRPVSAHELYVELVTRGCRPTVGVSTVYRTLTALADAGLLHVFVRDGEARYLHCATGHHYHLVCRRCGNVTEHPDAGQGDWLTRISREADFRPDRRDTVIHGVCGPCLRIESAAR